MPFRSLRARLLAAVAALIVLLMAGTLAVVSRSASSAVRDRVTADLVRSRETLAGEVQGRYDRLALVARLLASFPELMALMGTDHATVRDFLADYRERQARGELLLALDPAGAVVARSDTFAPLVVPDVRARWLDRAVTGQPAYGVLDVDGRPYHAALVPAEAGGTVFGFVAAASPIDARWAAALRDASGREIAVLGPRSVLGTSFGPDRAPWTRAADYAPPAGPDDTTLVTLGGERFESLAVQDPRAPELTLVALQSLDLALAPYRNVQWGILALGVVAIALGVAAAAMLARSITAPVAALTEATAAVTEGRFDVRLDESADDELGELARRFNVMTAGLRERADMRAFVSQSTVEMIQRGPATPETRAGARRVLTLLFADIRGFTAFSERRPPEEAVSVLNRYLQLQADLVRRFHGDVDKFMGDAVFAHFGGDDQVFDAIRCAVEMHRAAAGAHRADPTLPPLAFGIGIAKGEVLVGSVGGSDRLDYTAVGAPVNLAARLCAVAAPEETLMNDVAYDAVRGLVAAEAAPAITVKGFSDPVAPYRMRA
ncbi:MAG: adenylate/guanylate cyclase domain-containing protein [Vicinamibacterales bacterium]